MMTTDSRHPRIPRCSAICFAVAVIAAMAAPRRASAGAWAQEDKGLYVKTSVAYSFADEQYKSEGKNLELLSTNEEGRLESRALRLYAEFGLLPRLTYVASGSVVRHKVDSELVEITTTGLSDLRTGVKYQFLDDPFVASVSSIWTIPTGYTAEPDNPKVPTLGLGVPMHTARLLVGKSFYPVPIYVSAQAGFRLRAGRALSNGERIEYPPQIPYAAEVGVDATDWLLVRGALRGLHGVGDPEDLNVFTLSPTTQSYLKVGPSLIVTLLDRVQLNIDYLFTPVGVNALRSHEFEGGLAVDYAF